MEHERSLDRLAIISKIFWESRIATLRKQNEDLLMEIFWRNHNLQKLIKAMKRANYGNEKSLKCNCWRCSVAGRIGAGVRSDPNTSCKFIPWFETKLAECELTYEGAPARHSHVFHMSDKAAAVCDVDSHFVETVMIGGFLHRFTYGSKIWKATSVSNPELKKLEKLFKLITFQE
jgi:hypothetical protein